MKAILFFFSTILLTNAIDLTCPNGGTKQFDYRRYDTLYYPTKSGEVFPDNFICNYKINVPKGFYAAVQLYFNTTNPTNGTYPVVVTDSSQFSEKFYSASGENFYFVANGGNISLSTGMTNTNFRFSVYWWQLPTTSTLDLINVTKSDTQPQSPGRYPSTPFFVTAETRVSVIVTPPLFNPKSTSDLRAIMIFDGPDWNSTCLGSGMQLSKSKTQWVSTGKQMTILLLKYSTFEGPKIILQDYDNTKNIVQYQGFDYSQHQVVLDGSQGPSAIVTYGSNSDIDIVTSIVGDGTLDVYIGGVTQSKKNLIASYNVNNSASLFPQAFRGNFRTYVFSGINSKATMNLTSSYSSFIGDTQEIGRKGFIASSNYMAAYTNQYANEEIITSYFKLTKISFVIRCADITTSTTFNLTVWNKLNNTKVYNKQYNVTNLPVLNQKITAIGTELTVSFDSKNQSSNGLYMDFELLEYKGSANFCVFVSILIASLNIYFY